MHPGSPGWGLCSGLTAHSCKTSSVAETPTNLKDNSALGEDFRGWPRIGIPGELLQVAYAPVGAKGNDDDDDEGREWK